MERLQAQRLRIRARRDAEVAALTKLHQKASRPIVRTIPLPPQYAEPKLPPASKQRATPAPRAPSRLDALMKRILEEMSVPSQRKVYKKARELIRTDPAFQGLTPPPDVEVREYLADKPRSRRSFLFLSIRVNRCNHRDLKGASV